MTKRKSSNHIQKILDAHASEGFTAIHAQAANFEKIYKDAKTHIIGILRRQADAGKDPLVGKHYAGLLESLKKEFAHLEGDLRKAAKLGINEVSGLYYGKCVDLLKSQGYGILSEKISKTYVNGMIDDAWNHIAGATKKMQADHVRMLRELSARAFREASLTSETRKAISNKLFSEAVNKFNGNFQFIDKAGKKWNSDTYFDMLGRTVLHNSSRSAYFNACAQNKADIVRVSISGNPCPACAQWENRLLSISGSAPGVPSLQSAIVTGLFHPNCTHTITAVPASMQRKYFNNDGRPQKGLNGPGNIQGGDKAAWKKYRQSQKTKKQSSKMPGQIAKVEILRKGNKNKGPIQHKPNGTPVSNAINISKGKLKPEVEHALNVIDSVHGDGKLTNIPLRFNNLPNGIQGKFTYYPGFKPHSITIGNSGAHTALTTVHETGHFIDTFALGDGASALQSGQLNNLFGAIKKTNAFKRQSALLDGSRTPKFINLNHVEYLHNPKELFARAYSQYIATASGDKILLRQMNGILAEKYNRVYNSLWRPSDFTRVHKEFDKLFTEIGWIK